MKSIFIILLIAVISIKIDAQCLGKPHPFAIQDVTAICRVLGVSYVNVYTTTCSNVSYRNATATADIYGRPYIVYDPNWFEEIYVRLGRAANISILAHEIGHIISRNNHNSTYQSAWDNELQADLISGIAMRRLGYSLNEAMMAIENLSPSRQGDSTHPPLESRLRAIENGWNK